MRSPDRVAKSIKEGKHMAWKRVVRYNLGYSIPRREFLFYYQFEGETSVTQIFPTPEEFLALADMFRNERPINFNTDGNYFVTGSEPVGEEETP
jgi:hypothetical protein